MVESRFDKWGNNSYKSCDRTAKLKLKIKLNVGVNFLLYKIKEKCEKYEINFVRFVRVRSMEEKYPQWQNDLFTPAKI